ncbi:MAG: lipoprotein-releasing ABC transporter permease subunit [Cellvibrionales bacterium]
MLKNLPLYIGLRYTRSVRGEGYLSFVSALSMGAMAIGVMALITVLSVMNGFDREIKSRLLRIMPHLVALPEESLASADYLRLEEIIGAHAGVEAMIPLTQSYIMLSRADQKLGAMLRGIDPADAMHADLRQDMLAGDLTSLSRGDYGVVVGSQIARKLGLSMGDKLQLTLPQLSVTPLGMFPRIKSARVIGIFQVGAQVDGSTVLMHRGDVQKLLRLGDRYQGIQIQLRDPYAVATQMGDFVDLLPSTTEWHSWQQSMASLFDAMRMEKQIVRLLLSVIVAVAAFNIVASLVLMVSNKRADIAVIRTLGASSATVMKIFMVQGVAVGCVGIAIGTLLGCLLAANIGDLLSLIESVLGVHLFDPSVYLISVLPSKVLLTDVLSVALTSLALCFIASLYPAWRAAQIQPAEALRYDI